MAIRTVSNTGGNWNTKSTWVGNVKPVVGRDSVAFTATSGPLLLDGSVTVDTRIKGIDFRNYTNTFTLKGANLIIDDTNTSGRASFVNLGTGGYTIVLQDYLGGPVNPVDNNELGIYITPQLSQVCTLTSNGTPWDHVLYISTDQVVSLADNWVQNGRWSLDYGPSGQGTTLRNNSITLNGEHTYVDTTPGTEFVNSVNCYRCTSTIIFNRPTLYFGYNIFDGTNFVINSTTIIGGTPYSAGLSVGNSLGGTCNLTMTAAPIVDLPNGLYVNGGTVNITANVINGYLGSFAADTVLTCNATSVTGLDYQAGISCVLNTTGDMESINANITGNLSITAANITYASPANYSLISSGGNITVNATQIVPNGFLTVSAPLGTVLLNVPTISVTNNYTISANSINTSAVTSLTVPSSISITQTASNLALYTFSVSSALSLTTSLILSAANLNVSLNSITVPTCTITSAVSCTVDLGATYGSITTFNVTAPDATINKNNCDITTATITSATSVTITGINNILDTLNTTAPLLILDAANVMNSNTNINLTTNTTRTIQLTSAMDVNSIIGINTNLTSLTFTGNFDATIGIIDKIIALNLVANRQYTITQNAFLVNCTIASTTPGIHAKFNMIGANEPLLSVNAIDIDSSLTPRGVHTYFGNVTNCLNWRNFTDSKIPQVCSTF